MKEKSVNVGKFLVANNIKISVLTPSFNSGKYLRRAIKSVLIQDYKNWEHIVMDGGSSDQTVDILKEHPHLIWNSAPDAGQSDAMNKAFDRSNGQLIVYLNADDELAKGWFNEIIGVFEAKKNTDMVVGDIVLQYPEKSELQSASVQLNQIINPLNFNFPFNPVGYAYRRELQNKVGRFPVDNHYAMDYWFLLRAYLKGNITKIDKVGGTFYNDGYNKTSNTIKAIDDLKYVQKEFLKEYCLRKPVSRYIFQTLNLKIKRKFKIAIGE